METLGKFSQKSPNYFLTKYFRSFFLGILAESHLGYFPAIRARIPREYILRLFQEYIQKNFQVLC